MIENYLNSGNLLVVPISYIAGLIVSFTPCVYPLIPITVSFIGSQRVPSKFYAFVVSLVYVLGMVTTYSALGIIASLTGKIFGVFMRSPIVYLLAGILFVIMGLNMMEVLYLNFLEFSFGGKNVKKPTNMISVFLVGIMSGFVVGGCTSPVLGAILSFVALKQNLLLGILSMVAFGLGMGTLLIVVGVFSNILVLKSGKWMVVVKKILGVIIALVGGYFIYTAVDMLIS